MSKFERPLPSDHQKDREAAAKLAQDREEARKREEARVLAAFDFMAKNEHGRVVWKWLFERCGYNKPVLMRQAGGDIAPLSTECMAAIREVYRDVRKLVGPEVLASVELEAEFGIVMKTEFKSQGDKK